MLITTDAYHNLIQVQHEARKDELTEDPGRLRTEWQLKVAKQMGELATEINDGCRDQRLLQDIINLAETLRSWYWLETEDEIPFIDVMAKERKLQDEQWGPQNHHRMKWYLIAAEEAGEIADAVDSDETDIKLIPELIQLSAVLQAWVTSHDWFQEQN